MSFAVNYRNLRVEVDIEIHQDDPDIIYDDDGEPVDYERDMRKVHIYFRKPNVYNAMRMRRGYYSLAIYEKKLSAAIDAMRMRTTGKAASMANNIDRLRDDLDLLEKKFERAVMDDRHDDVESLDEKIKAKREQLSTEIIDASSTDAIIASGVVDEYRKIEEFSLEGAEIRKEMMATMVAHIHSIKYAIDGPADAHDLKFVDIDEDGCETVKAWGELSEEGRIEAFDMIAEDVFATIVNRMTSGVGEKKLSG